MDDAFAKAIAEKDLKKALRVYFDNRTEWQPVPVSIELHEQVKYHAIDERNKEKQRNPKTIMALPYRIEGDLRKQLQKPLLQSAELLYEISPLRIIDVHVMMNCRTKPMRCMVHAEKQGTKTFYVKHCNIYGDPRPLGIELVRCFGILHRDYQYIFDDYITLENHIDGQHLPIYDEAFKADHKKVIRAIEFTITMLRMGLRDLL